MALLGLEATNVLVEAELRGKPPLLTVAAQGPVLLQRETPTGIPHLLELVHALLRSKLPHCNS
eukprot:4706630-Lingulodinium_polyedra.AAC.1